MKKAIVIINILFIFLSFNLQQISAQSPSPEVTITPSPTPKPIQYNLAYPGILPDNPLYKLKVLRDKISEKLTNDPSKRIDFYLLQVDKQILATSMLIEKNKIDLAKDTALKGEDNYTKLVREYKTLNAKPKKDKFTKLKNAALKHQEILENIIKKVDEKDKKTFKNVMYFSQVNLQELNNLYSSEDLNEL